MSQNLQRYIHFKLAIKKMLHEKKYIKMQQGKKTPNSKEGETGDSQITKTENIKKSEFLQLSVSDEYIKLYRKKTRWIE